MSNFDETMMNLEDQLKQKQNDAAEIRERVEKLRQRMDKFEEVENESGRICGNVG